MSLARDSPRPFNRATALCRGGDLAAGQVPGTAAGGAPRVGEFFFKVSLRSLAPSDGDAISSLGTNSYRTIAPPPRSTRPLLIFNDARRAATATIAVATFTTTRGASRPGGLTRSNGSRDDPLKTFPGLILGCVVQLSAVPLPIWPARHILRSGRSSSATCLACAGGSFQVSFCRRSTAGWKARNLRRVLCTACATGLAPRCTASAGRGLAVLFSSWPRCAGISSVRSCLLVTIYWAIAVAMFDLWANEAKTPAHRVSSTDGANDDGAMIAWCLFPGTALPPSGALVAPARKLLLRVERLNNFENTRSDRRRLCHQTATQSVPSSAGPGPPAPDHDRHAAIAAMNSVDSVIDHQSGHPLFDASAP